MVQVTGYARKQDPKWFNFLFYLLILVLFSGAVVGIYSITAWINDLTEKWLHASGTTTTTATATTTSLTLPANREASPSLAKVLTGEISVGIADFSVEKMTIASGVKGNLPADEIESVSTSAARSVYCYTRIRSRSMPQTIRHVWLAPDGRVAADIQLRLSSSPVDTWSYINLYGARRGAWEVQVRTRDDKLIARKNFSVN